MGTFNFFTSDELRRIEDAVKQAESNISGEIVPVFVSESDNYEQGNLRGGVSFAVLASMVWMLVYEFNMAWSSHWFYSPEALIILIILGFSFGFLMAKFIPLFRMVFITKGELSDAVSKAASLSFLKEEVFKTKNRTGILIFITKLEHRVVVLGDAGISSKVSSDEWNHILKTIIDGLKTNQKTEGICKAIGEAQQLLIKNGFVADADDTNELPNNLRVQ